jgi:signal transduction histidine kinase
LAEHSPARFVMQNVLYVLGDVHLLRHHPKAALVQYRQALVAAQENKNPTQQADIYLRIARLYQLVGRADSSLANARQALLASEHINYLPGILPASQLLAQLYEGRDNAQALHYYKVAVVAKDSLFSQEKVKQLLTLSFEEQQRAQELAAAKLAYQERMRLYGLLGAVAVVAAIALLLWRTNQRLSVQKTRVEQQRQKAEQALQDLQTTQNQLIQQEKMASLGELTAGIAHEIQNPLNFVNNFSEVSTELLAELEDEQQKVPRDAVIEQALLTDIKQNLTKITDHGRRADAIVKGMLAHSHAATGIKQPMQLNQLADEYLRLAYQGLRAKDKSFACELLTDFEASLEPISMVPQDIGRVLLNLFNNAFYATRERLQQAGPAGYQPQVRVQTRQGVGHVELRVWDNGTGISEAVKDKIFQPFFTTKPTGQGTGLGLSLSYDMVTKGYDGSLTLENGLDKGTTFLLQLPAC